VNDILLRLGLIQTGINWLGRPGTGNDAVIFADVWKTAIYQYPTLAGLQSIRLIFMKPTRLMQHLASFRQITLPLLMPQILIALLSVFLLRLSGFST